MLYPEDTPAEVPEAHAQYLEEKGYGRRLDTKRALYALAREMQVAGRSTMKKATLKAAVLGNSEESTNQEE